jgi:hypothetical protein
LDYKRLGKQRVECKQILAALGWEVTPDGDLRQREPSKGWRIHPCTLMWRGYHRALATYQCIMIDEWVGRGYNNTMLRFTQDTPFDPFPPWGEDERVYASHRSNLLRKDPEHYGQFGWSEGPDLPYFYPEGL